MDQKMKVRRQKKMTIVTSKIVRGGVALFVALGIMTFGINSFQPVHASRVVSPGGGDGGTGGSGSGSGGSTTPAAPAAPYVTSMSVSVNGGQPSTTSGPIGVYWYGPPDQEVGTCTSNCMPTGGSMFTIAYKIQFADATPGANVICYVYVHNNPTVYWANSNLSVSFSTDGSNVYGYCYAQVGNGPPSAQLSLP
jgi:hypothetical protein